LQQISVCKLILRVRASHRHRGDQTFLAYIDVFWALVLISAAAIPLALSPRKVKLGGPAPVTH
jgi:hypothetical protein